MNLQQYLDHVGFEGIARPDLDTLNRLHRAHLARVPYENLDVQLGRKIPLDVGASFEKIVVYRRGGWCYEMNGLLAWALEEIGFSLTRLAGAVLRSKSGDGAIGNHLALQVHLQEQEGHDYLVDVGFGDGLIGPTPLVEGTFDQKPDSGSAPLPYRLEQLDHEWWRFHNQPTSATRDFDFSLQPADPDALARRSTWLQTAEQSPFVLNAVC